MIIKTNIINKINKRLAASAAVVIMAASLAACSGNTRGNMGAADNISNNMPGITDGGQASSSAQQGTYVGYLFYGEHLNASDEQKFTFPSFAKFENQYLEDWKKKLSADVRFLESRHVLTGYDEEHGWSKDFDVYMRYYTLDDRYFPVMYATTLHCAVDDEMKVYIVSEESTDGNAVTTAKQGNTLDIFSMVYNHTKFVPEQNGNQSLAEYLAENTETDELSNPALALGKLARVSGGKITDTITVVDDSIMCLVYTFADGSHLNYNMSKIGECWFIRSMVNDKYADTYRRAEQYTRQASAARLRAITQTMENPDAKYYELGDDFLLLGEDEEKDCALYGLFGCSAMVLRVGGSAYPVFRDWSDRGMVFAAADYDNDGTVEYAYSTCEGHGTGVYQERLHMLEINSDNTLSIRNMRDLNKQLERITYRYDEQQQALYWFVDGKQTGEAKDLSKAVSGHSVLKDVDLYSIQYVSERDGRWYLEIHPGIVFDSNVSPDFENDLRITAEIKYSADGTFTLADIVL